MMMMMMNNKIIIKQRNEKSSNDVLRLEVFSTNIFNSPCCRRVKHGMSRRHCRDRKPLKHY